MLCCAVLCYAMLCCAMLFILCHTIILTMMMMVRSAVSRIRVEEGRIGWCDVVIDSDREREMDSGLIWIDFITSREREGGTGRG